MHLSEHSWRWWAIAEAGTWTMQIWHPRYWIAAATLKYPTLYAAIIENARFALKKFPDKMYICLKKELLKGLNLNIKVVRRSTSKWVSNFVSLSSEMMPMALSKALVTQVNSIRANTPDVMSGQNMFQGKIISNNINFKNIFWQFPKISQSHQGEAQPFSKADERTITFRSKTHYYRPSKKHLWKLTSQSTSPSICPVRLLFLSKH